MASFAETYDTGSYFRPQITFYLQYRLKYGLKLWGIDLSNQLKPIYGHLDKQIGYRSARRAKKPSTTIVARSSLRVNRKDGEKNQNRPKCVYFVFSHQK